MIKDQIQYRSQSLLNLARGYFSFQGNARESIESHEMSNYYSYVWYADVYVHVHVHVYVSYAKANWVKVY